MLTQAGDALVVFRVAFSILQSRVAFIECAVLLEEESFMFRFLLSFSVLSATFLAAAPQPRPFEHPLIFEPNRGQAPAHVKWIARASGYLLLFTDEGATIVLPEAPADVTSEPSLPRLFRPAHFRAATTKQTYSTVQMKLTGSRPWTGMDGLEPTGGVSNYLRGSDPKRWHTDVPHYARMSARQVYDGIDLVFYSNGGDLEYDFIVAPGADPKQIQMSFDGVDEMRVDRKSGDLLLTTAAGSELRHVRPKVYQQVGNERVEVAGSYQLLDRRQATVKLLAYDRQRTLVIDPVLKFSTYLFGNGKDRAYALAVDGSGNVYMTGRTESTNLASPNALQTDQPLADAFVSKVSPTGAILYTTYLGGNGTDEGWGIAVDSTGVYVAGKTDSSDFPMKNALFQHRLTDGFVSKLTPAGNAFIYSTYLGGSKYDDAYRIAVDSEHAAWVVGATTSDNFPIAGGPNSGQQRKFGGGRDAFLAKIAPDGLSVMYSTFVGGPGDEFGYDVALDRTGSVYAIGSATTGFPITAGMKACGAIQDAFVVRVKGRGTQPRYATCLGPGIGLGIAVDTAFNAYATGYTYGNFPTTPGSFQPTKPATGTGVYSGFVTKLGSKGNVAYSTYFGATDGITVGEDIGVDANGAAYIGGSLRATNFPGVPPLPSDRYLGFLSKLTPQGKSLSYTMILNTGISAVAAFPNARQFYVAGRFGDSNSEAFVMKFE